MKKKVIFMVINMNVGGTERALLNMMAEMPEDKYEITIMMLEKYGEFLDLVPDRVRVKYLDSYQEMKDILNKPPKEVVIKYLNSGKVIKGLTLLLLYFITKVTKNKSVLFKYILKKVPSIKNEYDVAVAYAGPMDFISYFVIHKIKANKKIQWIHFDVTKIGFNTNFASKIYKYYDKIYVVSEEAKNKLYRSLPILKEKAEVFLNKVSPHIIRTEAQAGKGFNDNFEGLRILTVGRLSFEKGQDLAIRVLKLLINAGYDVKWYCLGEGIARDDYERFINEINLHDKFILLGSDPNPYPYIAQCDIYVQPSRYEGYCITLAEAKVFQKPIVTTNFTGATEQITNLKTGLIVNVDELEIFQAIKKIINNPMISQKFRRELIEQSTKEQTKKIYI